MNTTKPRGKSAAEETVVLPWLLFPITASFCAESDPELAEMLWARFEALTQMINRHPVHAKALEAVTKELDRHDWDEGPVPFACDRNAVLAYLSVALEAPLKTFAFVHPENPCDSLAMRVHKGVGGWNADKVPFISISRDRKLRMLPSVRKLVPADIAFIRMVTASQPSARYDLTGSRPRLLVTMDWPADEAFAIAKEQENPALHKVTISTYRKAGRKVVSENICRCDARIEGNTVSIEPSGEGLLLLSAAAAGQTVLRVESESCHRELGMVFRAPSLAGKPSSSPVWLPVSRMINPLNLKSWPAIGIELDEQTAFEITRKFWWFGCGCEFIANDLAHARPKLLAKAKKKLPE